MRLRLASLVVLGALLAACSGTSTASPSSAASAAPATAAASLDSTPLTLGAIIPLSGGQASYGTEAKGGLDVAVAAINAAGGVNGRQVVINYQDNQGIPAQSATAAQTLMAAGVKVIFTHGSSVTAAIANVTAGHDVLLANMAAQSDSVIAAAPQVYSFLPTNNMELGHLAALAYTKLGLKTLAIEASDDAYGKSATDAVSAAFTALGGKVVDVETHAPGAVDMRTQLIKIKAANPAALAILANTGEIGHVIAQARELGITATLMGADSALSPSEATTAGPAMEGVVGVAIHFDPALNADAKAFADAFQAKVGSAPNNYAAIAYEAARVTLKGIASVGSDDPTKLGAHLLGVKDYPSVLGAMSFGANRVVEFPYYDWIFTKGAAAPLQ